MANPQTAGHQPGWLNALLLCGLLCVAPVLAARDASAYLPPGEPEAPTFWWGLDLSHPPAVSGQDGLAAAHVIAALQAWLAGPRPGQRPYPHDDIRLGLLAVVPDRQHQRAVRVLHPPVALGVRRDWPAQMRTRLIEFSAGATLSADGRTLEASLPALPGGTVQALELTLPVQGEAGHGEMVPAHLLVEVESSGSNPSWSRVTEVPVQAVTAGHWQLDLSALAAQPLPAAHWRFRPAGGDAADWRWLPWSVADPAAWLVSWQEAPHQASGREQLQAVLADLLPLAPDAATAVMPAAAPGDSAVLTQALRQLQSGIWPGDAGEAGVVVSDAGCGLAAVLQLGLSATASQPAPQIADAVAIDGWRQPQAWQIVSMAPPWPAWPAARVVGIDALPSALDHWRDQALAPPPLLAELQPRQFGAALLGLDATWLQPVPGRLVWPGNHEFFPCTQADACAAAFTASGNDLRTRVAQGAGTLSWLSDAGLAAGQILRDWREVLSSAPAQDELLSLLGYPPDAVRRGLLQATLQDELAHPPVLQGVARYVDDGPDPGRVGGRRGYLAWGMADGGLLWLDADSGLPRWGWRPARMVANWLRHRLDPGSTDPALMVASDWQAWPGDSEYRTGQPRFLYGLGDGQLLALDISQPLLPRLLFRAALPADARVGSLGIFSLAGSETRPILLLARASPQSSTPTETGQPATPVQSSPDMLWLVDGRSGSILWRAAGSGHDANIVDARLQSVWRAPWRRLMAADGRQLLYGVDQGGQVWRLTLPVAASTDAQLAGSTLQIVATLADPALAAGAERFEDAPSVTWLADVQGNRLPALTLGSRTTAGESGARPAVFALLDRSWTGGAPLLRSQLADWPPSHRTSPDHVWGWLRRWADADEQLASPPRWLVSQVVLTTETAEPVSGCAPRHWRDRVYRLPWRVAADGSGGEAEEKDVGVTDVPLSSSPLLTGTGGLVWAGRVGAELALPVPAAYRIRTGKQPVPLSR